MAAAPYMMPIFLWSTVVSHLRQQRLGARAGRSTPSGSKSDVSPPDGSARGPDGVGSVRAMGELRDSGDGSRGGAGAEGDHLSVSKVGDQLVDLGLGEAEVGHAPRSGTPLTTVGVWASAGFTAGGLRSQASSAGWLNVYGRAVATGEGAAGVARQRRPGRRCRSGRRRWTGPGVEVEDRAGEGAAGGEVGEVRRHARDQLGADALAAPSTLSSLTPLMRWHDEQSWASNTALPGAASRPGGRLDRRSSAGSPPTCRTRPAGGPARACACWRGTGRRTRCTGPGRRRSDVGLELPAGGCWPGTASFLPFRAGIQKQWITSLEVIVELDLAADRDHQLGGGGDVAVAGEVAVVVDVVVEAPPPLLARDLDLHGLRRRLVERRSG